MNGLPQTLLDTAPHSGTLLPSAARTDCVDPTTPAPPGGSDGPNLLTNGDFESGLPPWTTSGSITSQLAGGVFEFYRPAGPPAGLVEQSTGQAMSANQILTAQFQLGNSSAVRKRVTVQLRDGASSDLLACTFWVPPALPLSPYAMRGFAAQAWANATLSVSPDTIGMDEWIRLDGVTLQRTPSTAIVGTECLEPGAAPVSGRREGVPASTATDMVDPSPAQAGRQSTGTMPDGGATGRGRSAGDFTSTSGQAWVETRVGWEAVAVNTETAILEWTAPIEFSTATQALLSFQSRLSTRASWVEVQVRTAAGGWLTLVVVLPSDAWELIHIDLGVLSGEALDVRFVLNAVAPADGAQPDVWQLDDLRLNVSPPDRP